MLSFSEVGISLARRYMLRIIVRRCLRRNGWVMEVLAFGWSVGGTWGGEKSGRGEMEGWLVSWSPSGEEREESGLWVGQDEFRQALMILVEIMS